MDFNEQGIKELTVLDELPAREKLIHTSEFKEQLRELVLALNKVDVSDGSTPWQDIESRFKFIWRNFENLEDMFSSVGYGLKIRAAAIEAKRIVDGGFNFDQILINGIHLHRTPGGFCEHHFFTDIPF